MVFLNINTKIVLVALAAFSATTTVVLVQGHGYLAFPASRNYYANQNFGSGGPGQPQQEYCPHCLNINEGVTPVCGTGKIRSIATAVLFVHVTIT